MIPGSPNDPEICNERSAQVSGPVYCGDSGGYCAACPKRQAMTRLAPQPAASGEPVSLDTPGNRHPEHRYAGYKGEPLKAGATDDQRKAWEEGQAAQVLPVCKGMNCGATDGRSHSLECHAEHAAAIAGGVFVPA